MPATAPSARQLLHRALTLIREHPILVLPLCAADLISFAAMHIQHALHQPLWNLLLGEQSVLSSHKTFVVTAQNATRATLLVLPLLWACYLLTVVLYTGALLVTSSFVRQSDAGDSPNLHRAMDYLRTEHLRWRAFILRFLVLLIAAAILMWLAGYLLFTPQVVGRFGGRPIGYVIGFLLETFVAVTLMPSTLRLLADTRSLDLKPLRHPAIVLGLMTIGLQIALTLFSDRVVSGILTKQTSLIGFLLCEAIPSLLGALTYLPLFIGLSLLTKARTDTAPVTE